MANEELYREAVIWNVKMTIMVMVANILPVA
jgi:hypothetical protein